MAHSTAQARMLRAVTLRNLGQSYQQIADSLWACDRHQPDGDQACAAGKARARCSRLYESRQAAWDAVQRELSERYGHGLEARDELRRHTLAQLDMLLREALRRALDPGTAEHPNTQQAVFMLRATQVLAQRAKLEGLYAPIRVEGTISGSWEAEIAELAEQIGRQQAGKGATHPG